MRLDVDFTPSVVSPLIAEHVTYSPDADESKSKDLLNQGIRSAQAGDRISARNALLGAVELDPKCENGWLWLASISEYPEELMAFLENVLDINPENERALQWKAATETLLSKTLVQRGMDAAEADQASYAEDCFRKALEYDQQNLNAWLWLASLSKDHTERVAYLERVLAIEPTNTAAVNALETIRSEECSSEFAAIRLAASDGRNEEAANMLQQFTEKYSGHIEGWMLLSHVASKPAEKLGALERVLEIDPSNQAARISFDSLSSLFAVPEPSQKVFAPVTEDSPANEPEYLDPTASAEASETEQPSEDFDPYLTCANLQFPAESFHQAPDHPIAEPDEELVFEPVFESSLVEGGESELIANVVENESNTDEPDWARTTETHEAAGHVENYFDFQEEVVTDYDPEFAIPMPADLPLVGEMVLPERTGFETTVEFNEAAQSVVRPCPYCSSEIDEASFVCNSCFAALTLSDLEMVLSNNNADRVVIRKAVEQMENERNRRDFDEAELTSLGIGHLNLRNLQFGYDILLEAAKHNPDNIMLSSQVNSLLIRMEEIRRQEEVHTSMTKGKTILVVDDSPTIRKLISGKLEKCGHEVFLSADGMEAMELLQELIPDLVLLDITMPRMDGYEVCRQIRSHAQTANIPVVMISGKDGFFDKVRGRMAGTTGYITKPFGPETLMKAIEYYLGGGQDFESEDRPEESEQLHSDSLQTA